MKASYRHWWKIVLIIFISILSNIILHSISPIESANKSLGEPSIFVIKGALIPALLVWEVLTFSIFSLVFLFIDQRLPGNKLMKGFLYGLSIGGLYIIGMFEAALLFNTAAFTEFLMGLPDFISFVISGTMLGVVMGTDQAQKRNSQSVLAIELLPVK